MTFVYNEATLTLEGRKAARLLLEYLTLKKFGSVTLSGHADEPWIAAQFCCQELSRT